MNCENCGKPVPGFVQVKRQIAKGIEFVMPCMCSEACYAEALIKQAEKVEEERNVKSHTAKP